MSHEEKFASITGDGAILLGNLFCCDGHSYERNHFAFSHMHSDHVQKLSKCLYNGQVFLSKPTRDLLEAINNENYGSDARSTIKKSQIKVLDYNTSQIVKGNGTNERITFYQSEHVLGASQIEVVTEKGLKLVYSGDITSEDIPPKMIHTLVIDPVHGHPKYEKHSNPESVERRFIDKIEEIIHGSNAQPIVIHAHQGKLQEIVSLISSHDEFNSYPQHVSAKDMRVLNVYKKYGFKIGDNILDTKSNEAEKQRDSDWPYIQYISSFTRKTYEINGKAHSIFLLDSLPSGEQMDDSDPCSTKFATTAHADYQNIIKYVERADPKYVIIDGYRTKQHYSLTEQLKKKGFNAEYQPRVKL